jgi:hypothetical protein
VLPTEDQANLKSERNLLLKLTELEPSNVLNNQNSKIDARGRKKKSRQSNKRLPSARVNVGAPLYEPNKPVNSARVSESLKRKKKIFASKFIKAHNVGKESLQSDNLGYDRLGEEDKEDAT